jgi:hypothetical protein
MHLSDFIFILPMKRDDKVGQYWEHQLHGLIRDTIDLMELRERVSQFDPQNILEVEIIDEESSLEIEGLPEQAKIERPEQQVNPAEETGRLLSLESLLIEPYKRLHQVISSKPFSRDRIFALTAAVLYYRGIELRDTAAIKGINVDQYSELLKELGTEISSGNAVAPRSYTTETFRSMVEPTMPRLSARDIGQAEKNVGSLYEKASAIPTFIHLMREWIPFVNAGLNQEYHHAHKALTETGLRLLSTISGTERQKVLTQYRITNPGEDPPERKETRIETRCRLLVDNLGYNDTRESPHERNQRSEGVYRRLVTDLRARR